MKTTTAPDRRAFYVRRVLIHEPSYDAAAEALLGSPAADMDPQILALHLGLACAPSLEAFPPVGGTRRRASLWPYQIEFAPAGPAAIRLLHVMRQEEG